MELSTTEDVVTKSKKIFFEGGRILLSLCQLFSIFFNPMFILVRDINLNTQTTTPAISSPQKSNSPLILNSFLCCVGEGNKPKRHWRKTAEGGTSKQGSNYHLSPVLNLCTYTNKDIMLSHLKTLNTI